MKIRDYVSRDYLLSLANKDGAYGYVSAHEIINAPSADVRPNIHGEWTRHTRVEPVYSIDGVKTWGVKCQCNQCTFTTIVVEDFGYYRDCPNCGADMRGEK